MRLKRSILSSDSGFTVLELLVSAFLGLIVVGLTLSVSIAKKNVLGRDMARTRLSQNLRGAMDIIGADVRVGGENLGGSFPAIEIIDGSGSNPDVLIARRNLIDEVIPLCTQLDAATTTQEVYFAIPGLTPGCIYSGQTTSFNAWQAYRTAEGGTVDAYIWDSSGRRGEYFQMSGEGDNGTSYWITRASGTWQNTYPVGSSAIYILEEWRYELNNGLLQVILNQDTASPYNVAFGVTGFQARALLQDGSVDTDFSASDLWTTIDQVEVTLTGSESFRKEPIDRTLVGRFFPRNVLSN